MFIYFFIKLSANVSVEACASVPSTGFTTDIVYGLAI